jgi:hypothetical protein
LDKIVWQDLCQVLLHPENITQALERTHTGNWLPQELQARCENLRRAQVQLDQQLDRLTDAYLGSIIPLVEYKRRRVELEQRISSLDMQANTLVAQADRQKELAGLTNSIHDFCGRVQQGLAHATFEQKRQLVELLVDRVVVTNDEVEIRYVIPTSRSSEHIRFCQLRSDYFADPFLVGLRSPELSLEQIGGDPVSGMLSGGRGMPAMSLPGHDLMHFHQSGHPISPTEVSFVPQPGVDARAATGPTAELIGRLDLCQQDFIRLFTLAGPSPFPGVIAASGYFQHLAHPLQRVLLLVCRHERILQPFFRGKSTGLPSGGGMAGALPKSRDCACPTPMESWGETPRPKAGKKRFLGW